MNKLKVFSWVKSSRLEVILAAAIYAIMIIGHRLAIFVSVVS